MVSNFHFDDIEFAELPNVDYSALFTLSLWSILYQKEMPHH